MRCASCQHIKAKELFGKRTDGYDRRCKVCINEATKKFQRPARLIKYTNAAKGFTPRKIASELEFLTAKVDILQREAKGRSLNRG